MAIRSPLDPASLVAAAVAVALFFATPAGRDLVLPSGGTDPVAPPLVPDDARDADVVRAEPDLPHADTPERPRMAAVSDAALGPDRRPAARMVEDRPRMADRPATPRPIRAPVPPTGAMAEATRRATLERTTARIRSAGPRGSAPPVERISPPVPSPVPATAAMAGAVGAAPVPGSGTGAPTRPRPVVMRIERVTPPAPPTAAMAEAVRATAARGNRVSLAEALAAARARQTILGTSLAARMTPTRVPEPVMPAVGSIGPEAGSSATVTVAEASVDEAPVAGATSDGPSVAGGLSADTPVVTPPPIDKTSETVLYASSADTLLRTFDIHDFSYLAVQNGEAAVPRVFVKAFPADIAEIDRVDLRKRLFLDSMLPIVLAANEAILADRQRLKTLRGNIAAGHPPSRAEARWLARLAARYEVAAQDLDTLLARVDVVPSSMALAQAAVESGWGTSSLARRGNALFGQIVADPTDGIPASDGDHGYAAFDSLSDSVASYARNLNTHPAYQDFRALRARMRAAGEPLDGHALMGTLDAYSERGQDYIAYVRRLMRANDLQLFDRVRLDGGGLAPRWPRLTADRT